MAEVRKKVVEDKYNTSSIKVKDKSKNTKKESNTKKTVKKVSYKMEEKPNLWVRFRMFCSGVKSEFLKVHWTSKNDMIKYSIACIFFIIFCSLFFYLIFVIFAFVQSLFA